MTKGAGAKPNRKPPALKIWNDCNYFATGLSTLEEANAAAATLGLREFGMTPANGFQWGSAKRNPSKSLAYHELLKCKYLKQSGCPFVARIVQMRSSMQYCVEIGNLSHSSHEVNRLKRSRPHQEKAAIAALRVSSMEEPRLETYPSKYDYVVKLYQSMDSVRKRKFVQHVKFLEVNHTTTASAASTFVRPPGPSPTQYRDKILVLHGIWKTLSTDQIRDLKENMSEW